MVVESLRTSHVTRGVPAFLTSAVSQNKNELTDPNYLDDTVTPVPAAPQLSTVITPRLNSSATHKFCGTADFPMTAGSNAPKVQKRKLRELAEAALRKFSNLVPRR